MHWKSAFVKKLMSQISGKNNGMIVNKKKHQALILGKNEHNFCFPVNNSLDIFGMTKDKRLSFDNHVSVICKKINNHLIKDWHFGTHGYATSLF